MDIRQRILDVLSTTLRNRVEGYEVDAIIEDGKFIASRIGETTMTHVVFQTAKGFTIGHGESACVDPRNYNAELGRKYAIENLETSLKDKVWKLEGYALSKRIEWHVENIIRIAKAAHEVNKVHCENNNDLSQVAWENAASWQKEAAVEGVLFLLQNPGAEPEDSHEFWCADKEKDGWVYGEEKCARRKTHPCLVPYGELPEFQQQKDAFYCAVVKSMLPSESEY